MLYLSIKKVPIKFNDKTLSYFFPICILFVCNNNIAAFISIIFAENISIVCFKINGLLLIFHYFF